MPWPTSRREAEPLFVSLIHSAQWKRGCAHLVLLSSLVVQTPPGSGMQIAALLADLCPLSGPGIDTRRRLPIFHGTVETPRSRAPWAAGLAGHWLAFGWPPLRAGRGNCSNAIEASTLRGWVWISWSDQECHLPVVTGLEKQSKVNLLWTFSPTKLMSFVVLFLEGGWGSR